MANPNILNSTSVKYVNYTRILEKELYTISTSPTSDYQTKNIVLRNDVNSGKILKINRIYFSNQCVSGRNTARRDLHLTYITDYTDATIADTSLSYSSSVITYGNTRLPVSTGGVSVYFKDGDPELQSKQILPQTYTQTSVGITTTSLFYGMESFYLMEGNALECWADAYGYNNGTLTVAEYFRGRARIHIEYEEFVG